MRTESQYSWEVQSRWELQSPPLCGDDGGEDGEVHDQLADQPERVVLPSVVNRTRM